VGIIPAFVGDQFFNADNHVFVRSAMSIRRVFIKQGDAL